MACSLRTGSFVSGSSEIELKTKRISGFCSLQYTGSKSIDRLVLKCEFKGQNVIFSDQRCLDDWNIKSQSKFAVHAQASLCVSRSLRWWEKTIKINMIEINSAQELVDSLLNAGDKLVIIDFYSPGCGGCKTLHPKICQFAESNPEAIFLKVNYEELNTLCGNLNIKVLPFFRFYRGAEGRLCSFSCTNATINKFKNALAKHGTDRCSLQPAKGLDESEILKLVSSGQISKARSIRKESIEDLVQSTLNKIEGVKEENAVLVA